MSNIVLLTQGTGGDLHPLIGIGEELLSRGHAVKLVTNCRFAEEVRGYGLEFAPLDRPERVEAMSEMMTPEGLAELSSRRGVIDPRVLAACMDIYEIIEGISAAEPTVVVAHHNLNVVTQTATERLGLPYIPVFTAPYFLQKLPMIEDLYFHDSPTINRYRAELGLAPIEDWRAWLRSPRWMLGLWPEWFAPRSEMPCPVTAAGFASNRHFEQGRLGEEVEEFLSAGEPPVLITHGTSRPHRAEFFGASVEACAALGLRALVVTPNETCVPASLPGCVRRFTYLPFETVLKRVRAVVHHGGIGTLHHAMAAAVPQLILGFGFDRPDNGLRVRRLGVGDYLPPARWKAASIAQALGRVLGPEVATGCREAAGRLRGGAGAVGAAANLIERPLALCASMP
jgi:UDP:flavonoid glycosyltransferase YjiC (YdhE family)